MKLTYILKTFAAKTFRCSTLAGFAAIAPYRVSEAQAVCTGSAAGESFLPGATVGQDHTSGTTTGQSNA
jgi:hypothetical protein